MVLAREVPSPVRNKDSEKQGGSREKICRPGMNARMGHGSVDDKESMNENEVKLTILQRRRHQWQKAPTLVTGRVSEQVPVSPPSPGYPAVSPSKAG